jgi:tetratricopeptide (TPR) repeat protein
MQQKWSRRLFWTSVSIAGGLFLVAALTMLFGRVEGEEFSPGSFRRRSFYYFELPLTRLQVWPVRRMDISGNFEEFLRQYGDSDEPDKAAHWDLVRSRRVGGSWQWVHANLLCRFLDARDRDGEIYWLHWSREQPELAKVLWPEIASLAKSGQYLLIPSLFQLATAAPDPATLRKSCDARLSEQYESLAQIKQELHDYATALEYYEAALKYDPSRTQSDRGCEQCRRALEMKNDQSGP